MTVSPAATVSFGPASAVGASLTSTTVRVKVAEEDAGGVPSSVAVTRTVRTAGVSASRGVPLKVRVAASKESQAGSASLLSRAAVYVTAPPSGSITALKV